jgi:IS30 family transposase
MYNHLSKDERDQISYLHAKSLSPSEIGWRLNRHKSTISRELKRNIDKKGYYLSHSAQQKSEKRWKMSHY